MKKIELLIFTLVLCAVTAIAGIGTVSVTTAETEVLAARVDRKWFVLQNNSTNDIYVKIASDTNAVTSTNGIKLAAGASLTAAAVGANPARNKITAISAAGTNSLTYQEGNEN